MYRRWDPYVPVAERRRRAEAEMKRRRAHGKPASPIHIESRAIARTPWGKAWCAHIEGMAQLTNRLPRGRTYVRNGSVIDLQIGTGRVDAVVSGSHLYDVKVTVSPLQEAAWRSLCTDCAGGIDSMIELLQGKVSAAVMERMCHPSAGLMPTNAQLTLRCSCPDGAHLCKHLAAVLYGVGARLDHAPELLFTLRDVDPADLMVDVSSGLGGGRGPEADRVLGEDDLSALFGLDLEDEAPAADVAEGAKSKAIERKKPPSKGTMTQGAKRAKAKVAKPRAAKAKVAKAKATEAKAEPSIAPTPSDPGSVRERLVDYVRRHELVSLVACHEALGCEVWDGLQSLVADGVLRKVGKGGAARYLLR